ncbi:hypothetical protein P389DRAFT_197542 [Cystobasidium minutum MCA 4210]|uniref:uncharacterized protein n=1 Tax=Cystobasidium minutum MCA 4210 TaxID=1397322 RepID=UPI0034CF6905|eukprot:jgi/Rhomi1/197542/gm1.5756_g
MTTDPATPHPDELALVALAEEFMTEIKDLTPGKKLEAKLNTEYGPESRYYKGFEELALRGLKDGWLANVEIEGPRYRRSRLRQPSEQLNWFSITAVYMDSLDEAVFSGQYHAHPYGEINMSIQVPGTGPNPQLEGLNDFWAGKGWTCPGPGSHHYPRVRGGGVIALFFLPAGRISYNATPDMPQPADPGSALGT